MTIAQEIAAKEKGELQKALSGAKSDEALWDELEGKAPQVAAKPTSMSRSSGWVSSAADAAEKEDPMPSAAPDEPKAGTSARLAELAAMVGGKVDGKAPVASQPAAAAVSSPPVKSAKSEGLLPASVRAADERKAAAAVAAEREREERKAAAAEAAREKRKAEAAEAAEAGKLARAKRKAAAAEREAAAKVAKGDGTISLDD
eukprot:gnl/TRDRNA2_/TRDRNA2_169645_c0_seq2.p1 gnl/TRDRNA2_/TRDRNA2_169645_c0~~gnl/TRDRNA2_/TRDRNA2_169645_c0_seq2.p1  ORF type:complete len:202 (+),score=67.54 gnl/TRDRNA2_/TRDRNA2_169645_c0_seq2:220-825(+)